MQSLLIFTQAGGRNPTVLHSDLWKWHSQSELLLWSYSLYTTSCLLWGQRAWCIQSASEAVSGSDQVVWPSREPRSGQWQHCAAEVSLVSVTLPANESGRSKMAARRVPCWCLSWSKQASFNPFFGGCGGGGFSPRAHSRAGRFKAMRPLLWVICWHFVCFKGAKRQWGKRGRTVGQVQIESGGLPFVRLLLELQSHRSGAEMF